MLLYITIHLNPNKMAVDINELQTMLTNASKNELLISEIRIAANKATNALAELNALLADSYVPVKKERKPRAPKALGEDSGEPKKRGRKPKSAAAAE